MFGKYYSNLNKQAGYIMDFVNGTQRMVR